MSRTPEACPHKDSALWVTYGAALEESLCLCGLFQLWSTSIIRHTLRTFSYVQSITLALRSLEPSTLKPEPFTLNSTNPKPHDSGSCNGGQTAIARAFMPGGSSDDDEVLWASGLGSLGFGLRNSGLHGSFHK